MIAENESYKMVPFMGTENSRLEILFLSPAERRNGIGRKLVQYGTMESGKSEDISTDKMIDKTISDFNKHVGMKIKKI